MGMDVKMIPKNILVDLKKEGIDPGQDNNLSANEIVTGWKKSGNQNRAENVIRTYFAFLYNKDENAAENLRLEIRNLSEELNNSLKTLHAELALINGEQLLIDKGVKITIDGNVSGQCIYDADLKFGQLKTGGIQLTGYKLGQGIISTRREPFLHVFSKANLTHLKEIKITSISCFRTDIIAVYDNKEPETIAELGQDTSGL